MIVLSAIVGLIIGMVASWTLAFAAPPFLYNHQLAVKIIEGCILGGVLGGLIGSISLGDPNRASSGVNHNFLVAAIFGVIGGVIGSTRGDVIFQLLDMLRIPLPFKN